MAEITWAPGELDRDSKFYVAGHNGMVGAAVWRHLEASGFSNLVGRRSSELDLRNRDAVFEFFEKEKPRYVVLAAARVGGIMANNTYPAEFLSDNLQIQVNVMDAAAKYGVERLLFMGSSCIYPKFAEQPIKEESLLTGYLEPTNDAYAIAKIAGIMQVQATRRQYGLAWISAMPTNLYGVGDNYSGFNSHVIPALIKRYEEARLSGETVVTNWGTGSPLREFLYVDDLATATLYLLEKYDGPQQVNVGTGSDVSIREIAELVAVKVGYEGRTEWDESKPDGTPKKLLDNSRIKALGWDSRTSLEKGLGQAILGFRSQKPHAN
jgi:GDP-L-fucose synthase